MTVHPLWSPYEQPTQHETDQAFVSGSEPRTAGPIEVVPYDPEWPATFERVAASIREALQGRELDLQHVGSTSVPGLPAKPVIDVDLVLADPAAEDTYVPALERRGYVLRVREPWWQGHRMLRHERPAVNLHVFGPDAVEPRRHRLFRDWLRRAGDDRAAYAALKTDLSGRSLQRMSEYNAAKSALVYEIYEHAFLADVDHPHDPQPID
ncbi:GrpB family protein [Mumia sp. zg.B53]|uniref:GrpB family protein n=1 Tax=Mumia sp. zg.B53 TaxID=2855449 RepID=UPI001C6EB7A1|nr:GrpB family protein [Mumia sp. zg.B53]MBW9213480.1 GrpB family protein [Mumia sp. zg.B53]